MQIERSYFWSYSCQHRARHACRLDNNYTEIQNSMDGMYHEWVQLSAQNPEYRKELSEETEMRKEFAKQYLKPEGFARFWEGYSVAMASGDPKWKDARAPRLIHG